MSAEPRASQARLAEPPVLGAEDLENNDHTSQAELSGTEEATGHEQLDAELRGRDAQPSRQMAWTGLAAGEWPSSLCQEGTHQPKGKCSHQDRED